MIGAAATEQHLGSFGLNDLRQGRGFGISPTGIASRRNEVGDRVPGGYISFRLPVPYRGLYALLITFRSGGHL